MPSLPHGKSKFVSPLVKSTPAAAASSSRPTSNLELKRKASALEGPSTSSTLPRKKTGPPLAVRALQPDRKVFYGVAQMQQEAGEASADAADDAYWNVQWRKPQTKKHKTWDGDAILVVRGAQCWLKDQDGKDIGTGKYSAGALSEGCELKIAGKDVLVDTPISRRSYARGDCFTGKMLAPSASSVARITARAPGPGFKPIVPTKAVHYNTGGASMSDQPRSVKAAVVEPPRSRSAVATRAESPEEEEALDNPPLALAPPPVEPPVVKLPPPSNFNLKSKPRFDPSTDGATVMKRPTKAHQTKHNPKGLDLVDVVLDPLLGDRMREHQKLGLKFMYDCVMGMKKVEGQGVIMADEMGLGKTLQTIALVWTLLKQSPYVGPGKQSVIGKALIVCPVTLTDNWQKEFNKWLGRDRLGVMVGDKDKTEVKRFVNSTRHQVLVIGYEKLRSCIEDFKHCHPPIDLIVCDEGHRLKSKDAKTSKMFDHLKTKRRVILSGTPLQNDLHEYWSMVDFINPGILDSYSSFNKIYEKPILKSRDPKSSEQELELGRARNAKLSEIGKQFVIRRYAKDILSKYLPPKCEYVVFVAPTALQLDVLCKLLEPSKLGSMVSGAQSQALALVMQARKVCNSPTLLRESDEAKAESAIPTLQAARKLIPSSLDKSDMAASGKMLLLADLLRRLKDTTQEKIVLVSSFTSTLDVFEAHCKRMKYRYERLDGKTVHKKRQESVERFNRGSQSQSFVFLLSAKSGGAGLNLIGASRLVMFDSDWNPSVDLQAMARVHRDGQKRKVFIYRFLTAGTIEEKIYQRQITKIGLSTSVLDDNPEAGGAQQGPSNTFTPEELRDIFTFHARTACQTHDAMGCDCLDPESLSRRPESPSKSNAELLKDLEDSDGDVDQPYISTASNVRPEKKNQSRRDRDKQASLAALKEWTHVECLVDGTAAGLQDDILRDRISSTFAAPSPTDTISSSNSKPSSTAAPLPTIDSDDDFADSDAFESLVADEDAIKSDVELEGDTLDESRAPFSPAGAARSRSAKSSPLFDLDSSLPPAPLARSESPPWDSDVEEEDGSSKMVVDGPHLDPDGSDEDSPGPVVRQKPRKIALDLSDDEEREDAPMSTANSHKPQRLELDLTDEEDAEVSTASPKERRVKSRKIKLQLSDDSDSDVEALDIPSSAQPPLSKGESQGQGKSQGMLKGKGKAVVSDSDSTRGQTNLRQIAASGLGGTITFLFEKMQVADASGT